MIDKIEVQFRGTFGFGTKRQLNASTKEAWRRTGLDFAINHIPRRFTSEWATIANYQPRSGQNLPRGSKQFWRSYFGRKLKYKKTGDPFVWSGETRRNARIANVSATANAATIRLPSARRLNFHPKYAADFRRIPAQERQEIAQLYAAHFNESQYMADFEAHVMKQVYWST